MAKKRNRLTTDAAKSGELSAALTKLKQYDTNAVEAARLQKMLTERGYTQIEIAVATGKSRSAIANEIRLLSLDEGVLAMVERGELSAGHARSLLRVPREKQLPFALETVRGGYSVRRTERAVKVFVTPPEVIRAEKEAFAAVSGERLRAFVDSLREHLRLKVSLVGSVVKGRIFIDYFSEEELRRIEAFVDAAREKENAAKELSLGQEESAPRKTEE